MEMKQFQKDKLKVKVLENVEELGKAAAKSVAKKLNDAIAEKTMANLILATGASQFTFLEHLQKLEIDWKKITVFHLDEYKGMSESHPASFRRFLKDRVLQGIKPKNVYFMNCIKSKLHGPIQ